MMVRKVEGENGMQNPQNKKKKKLEREKLSIVSNTGPEQ